MIENYLIAIVVLLVLVLLLLGLIIEILWRMRLTEKRRILDMPQPPAYEKMNEDLQEKDCPAPGKEPVTGKTQPPGPQIECGSCGKTITSQPVSGKVDHSGTELVYACEHCKATVATRDA